MAPFQVHLKSMDLEGCNSTQDGTNTFSATIHCGTCLVSIGLARPNYSGWSLAVNPVFWAGLIVVQCGVLYLNILSVLSGPIDFNLSVVLFNCCKSLRDPLSEQQILKIN